MEHTYDEYIQRLRDLWGEYHCSMRWYHKEGVHSWGAKAKYEGYAFSFSHECGDGCCSWSNDYFIDKPSDTYTEFAEFFAQNPSGEEYYSEPDEDE